MTYRFTKPIPAITPRLLKMNPYGSDYYQAWHNYINYNNYILQNYYHQYIPPLYDPTGGYIPFSASSHHSGFYQSTPTAPNAASCYESVINTENAVSSYTSPYSTNQGSGSIR